MKRVISAALTLALIATASLPAFAQHHDNNNTQHAAPASHPAPPSRPAPAPAPRPAPAQPAAPTRGFDLHQDTAPQPKRQAPQPQRPTTMPVARRQPSRPAPQQPGGRGNAPVAHNPTHNNHSGGRRISNPQYGNQGGWGWNSGVVWSPADAYWGGGFWGPFAFDLIAAAFGSYDDNNQIYDSYEVLPDSPGATLLANSQLTQTPCGPPNLVVIWGPDNSVICAFPNDLVSPGEYDVDPTTLSLVSDTDSQ